MMLSTNLLLSLALFDLFASLYVSKHTHSPPLTPSLPTLDRPKPVHLSNHTMLLTKERRPWPTKKKPPYATTHVLLLNISKIMNQYNSEPCQVREAFQTSSLKAFYLLAWLLKLEGANHKNCKPSINGHICTILTYICSRQHEGMVPTFVVYYTVPILTKDGNSAQAQRHSVKC